MKHPNERFLRSVGIVSDSQMQTIKSTSIAIGGLGLGGSIFLNLVRMGFEKFHVADPDTYERTNINRQRMAKESTVGVRKDTALIKEAMDINPEVKIKTFPQGVNQKNVGEFLTNINWVVDVVDVFAIPEKLALNSEAAKRGLPVASSGSIGFSASVVVFDKTTPSFSELTGMSADLPYEENIQRFVRFITPEVPEYMRVQLEKALRKESHIPFVVPGVEIAAAIVTTEIAKQILNLGQKVRAPYGIHVDPVELKIQKYDVAFDRARNVMTPKKAA
jgi:molybdopterin/thiamine biosynthesis adenylyltransferase